MPSLLKDYNRTWAQEFCGNVLKRGPMPKHIGFIMDGNRRYAKEQKMGHAIEGHRKGDEKISEVCQMMVDLDIPEATAYFFSLENFKRTPNEVNGLMTIFEERMHSNLGELTKLQQQGYGVDIVGDYTKASTPTLRNLFARVMWSTRNNKKFRFNVAFAYAGQTEISRGLNILSSGLSTGEILTDDVNEKFLNDIFSLRFDNPPDIIIRTGSDQRLSDFMIWRGSNAYLEFIDLIKWPQFTCWHLLRTIFRYQIQVTHRGLITNCTKEKDKPVKGTSSEADRKLAFREKCKESFWESIREDANKI